jgi:hypothetical protein
MTCRTTPSQIRFNWLSEPKVGYESLVDITAAMGLSAKCQKRPYVELVDTSSANPPASSAAARATSVQLVSDGECLQDQVRDCIGM